MQFAAVVFDLDGTLLDTLADIADSANRVLSGLGLSVLPREHYKIFVGEGVARLFERILPTEMHTDESMRACAQQFRAEYERGWNVLTKPYDEADQLLRELAKRGIKMTVLSNKPHDFAVRCVQEYFGSHDFDMVLGPSDEVPAKPDPAGALRMAEHLGLPVDQCLFLGDTGTDMETAVAAGMYPVGALWGFRSREEVESAGAKQVIARPLELLPVLDGTVGI